MRERGRRTKWPGQSPGASQGPQRWYTEGATTDESARGPEGELSDGVSTSASIHSSGRSESDDRDDGGSDGNGPNDENTYGENGCTSGWGERNGGDERRSDCVQTGGKTPSRSTSHC